MIVIKVGGGEKINHEAIFRNIKALLDAGERMVVVHGANYEMRVTCDRLGQSQRMLTSVSGIESRYTDAATMEIFQMVYCGKVNKSLVEMCHQLSINAVGLSGLDGALLTGPRKDAIRVIEDGRKKIIRDDLTGRVEKVNTALLQLLIDNGYLPLVCPPALSIDHQAINVDGDRAAAMIASAMSADKLIILSDVPGLLRDKDDESSLIREVSRNRMEEFESLAGGRMRKKIMGAAEALAAGVNEVVFADGRGEYPIDRALERKGTWIH